MAQIIGISGAWKDIVRQLNTQDLAAKDAEDIRNLLNSKVDEYKEQEKSETMVFEEKLARHIRELDNQKKNFRADFKQSNKDVFSEIATTRDYIRTARKEVGFIRGIINSFKIWMWQRRIKHLKSKLRKRFNKLSQAIKRKDLSIKYRQENKEKVIRAKCEKTLAKIKLLEDILKSSEFAGAIAELEIIEVLKQLPNNYIVINDVKIVARRAIRFDRQWLKSAQIDHIVISPAGVFVIETKNWSKAFIEYGNYFDPYQQIRRSSYLCYKYLKLKLKGTIIRSIIAYRENPPKSYSGRFVKTLHFKEVNNYITWFKEQSLNDGEIHRLAEYIK